MEDRNEQDISDRGAEALPGQAEIEAGLRGNCSDRGSKALPGQAEIEAGLRGKWKKKLFTPFAKAVRTYELIQDGDKIAVCISGGKDSMLMAKLFQELKKHRKRDFELVFLMMDPGYNPVNRQAAENNARRLGIPLEIFESPIFDYVYDQEKNPCYLCARMRRGDLYAKARDLGCNKIALGHHYDDVIETVLMGMLYSGQFQSMMPKLHSANFPGMELIRPMYLVREADIRRWCAENDLRFLRCACRFTEQSEACGAEGENISKRLETKRLIQELKRTNPDVESHIFKSTENVVLDTVLSYKYRGERHHFLDDYDRES